MWISHDSVPRDERGPEHQYFWSGSLLNAIESSPYQQALLAPAVSTKQSGGRRRRLNFVFNLLVNNTDLLVGR